MTSPNFHPSSRKLSNPPFRRPPPLHFHFIQITEANCTCGRFLISETGGDMPYHHSRQCRINVGYIDVELDSDIEREKNSKNEVNISESSSSSSSFDMDRSFERVEVVEPAAPIQLVTLQYIDDTNLSEEVNFSNFDVEGRECSICLIQLTHNDGVRMPRHPEYYIHFQCLALSRTCPLCRTTDEQNSIIRYRQQIVVYQAPFEPGHVPEHILPNQLLLEAPQVNLPIQPAVPVRVLPLQLQNNFIMDEGENPIVVDDHIHIPTEDSPQLLPPSSIDNPTISEVTVPCMDLPVLYLRGENMSSFVNFVTPHFDRTEFCHEMFIYKSSVIKQLPISVVLSMSRFWSGRVRDYENFILSQRHLNHVLELTTLPLSKKDECYMYLPLISYAHNYNLLSSVCVVNRNNVRVVSANNNARRIGTVVSVVTYLVLNILSKKYKFLKPALSLCLDVLRLYYPLLARALSLLSFDPKMVLLEVIHQSTFQHKYKPLLSYMLWAVTLSPVSYEQCIGVVDSLFPSLSMTFSRFGFSVSGKSANNLMRALNGNIKIVGINCNLPLTVAHRGSMKVREFNFKKQISNYQNLFYGTDMSYKPVMYASTQHNEKVSLLYRTLKITPTPNDAYVDEFSKFFKRNIRKLLPKTFKYGVREVSFDQYILKSNAKPGVKKKLKLTYKQLSDDAITSDSKLSGKLVKKWVSRKAFVKVENTNHVSDDHLTIKSPRMIQGAQPEFICLVGPWIMALQDMVKRDLNSKNNICFTSGVSNFNAATKLMEIPGNLVEDDVSSWDVSMCAKILKLEVWLVRRLKAPKATVKLMQNNVNTSGNTTHGIKFKTLGTRKSGDPYTSLFNSIMNIMFHMFIMCNTLNKTFQQVFVVIRMLVQGDDNVLKIPSLIQKIDFKANMLKLGFSAKASYKKPTEVQFCSMRLYPVKGGWTFLPKIGKVLCKFGNFVDPPVNAKPEVLVRGSALGLYAGVACLPAFKAYMDKVLDATRGFENHPVKREDWQMSLKPCEASIDTHYFFGLHYDYDHFLHKSFIREIDKISFSSVSIGPIFRWLCDRDTAGVPVTKTIYN